MPNCPVCKAVDLHFEDLLSEFSGLVCESCNGFWIREIEFDRWVYPMQWMTFDVSLPKRAEDACKYSPMEEGKRERLCPDCGHFLRRYCVQEKLEFYIDRCNHCNGVWVDCDEWSLFDETEFSEVLCNVLETIWKQKANDDVTASKLDTLYLEKFGAVDYEKVKEIREWFEGHPKRSMLLAFLMDDDPFSD